MCKAVQIREAVGKLPLLRQRADSSDPNSDTMPLT